MTLVVCGGGGEQADDNHAEFKYVTCIIKLSTPLSYLVVSHGADPLFLGAPLSLQ